ncbi:MFS transporter [Actinokineospora pegani]|uniref:MFS transporter n=1 Tax=Actinokineospora pegani TaxID=2654637 RepID=UPI0018D442F9|nr:MFS transporter [Actinokineospora pegani]
MDNEEPRPRGDAFGSRGETVVTQNVHRELRTLRQRQLALLVLCVSSLVIILDASVVNVALPSIQADLGFEQHNLAWVVNAYLVPFGGILLFAGRLGDLVGAKRVFISGLALFTAASVACGLAQNQAMLIGARFVQGIGGALAAAVVLGMIVRMFPKPAEQTRALSFYAFVASSGAVIGVLLGALLTDAVSWNWVFFVNVPIGVAALVAARALLVDERDEDTKGVDLPGTVLLVGSLTLLVYAAVQTTESGWLSARTGLLFGGVVVGLALFTWWQAKARDPLLPLSVFRGRNVAGPNLVITLMVCGPTATFFFIALHLQQVERLSVMQVGLAFLPMALVVAVVSLKLTPRMVKKVDAKGVLLLGLGSMALGLAWLGRLGADSGYLLDVLPGLLLIGLGAGLGMPASLGVAVADATRSDSGVRSGLVNTTQQVGGALGLGVLAALAAGRTESRLAAGESAEVALTSGFSLGFLVAAGVVALALGLATVVIEPAVPKTAPAELDPTRRGIVEHREDLTGAVDPDFLAIGLGGANMMSMLWSIAHGKRSVGVELRGDPAAAVMHWTVQEDLYHHLAEIDRMILERYGADRVPRLDGGRPFLLHECMYNPDNSSADARADEVLTVYAGDAHVAGLVRSTELVDDRVVDGVAQRTLTRQGPVGCPGPPDPAKVGRPLEVVLGEPPRFLAGARELVLILRRYLQALERMDLESGHTPRCRLFLYHRVIPAGSGRGRRAATAEEGFSREADGRLRVRIEGVRELESKGSYRRVRRPGTETIDLGVPELFVIAEGPEAEDAARLGFRQEPMLVDRGDGLGAVPAQADYLVGLMTIYLDSRYRRRICSEFDRTGAEYWVRQIAVGHEDDAEISWIAVEVPDFMTFDPVLAGLCPPGTAVGSREFYAGYQHLVREYYLDQVAVLTELPRREVGRISVARTPQLVTVTAQSGVDAVVAPNGVVAGDSFGTSDFLLSGGFTAGGIGHACRVHAYWTDRAAGVPAEQATRALGDRIKADTEAWLRTTVDNFAQPPAPDDPAWRASVLEMTRSQRRAVAPVTHRDEWSRLHVFVGRLHSYPLPPMDHRHPDHRDPDGAKPSWEDFEAVRG